MDIAQQDLEVKRYALGTPEAKNLHGTLSTGPRNPGAKGVKTSLNHYTEARGKQSAFDRFNY